MSRLEILAPSRAQLVVEDLYKNLEHRIVASPPGLCPVDITRAFIEMCHSQTCGKCVPCRVGLLQLKHLLTDVLNGDATMDTLNLIDDFQDGNWWHTSRDNMEILGADSFKSTGEMTLHILRQLLPAPPST